MIRARCQNCKEELRSKSVHDWVCCSCWKESGGSIGAFVDGGDEYFRCGGTIETWREEDQKWEDVFK